jgi:hypothetical protein
MLSLFTDQELEAKLGGRGGPLALRDKHVDFAALVAEIDRWAPRTSRAKSGWRGPRETGAQRLQHALDRGRAEREEHGHGRTEGL